MTNTFISHFACSITPSVLNHRAYTTSSAAARNLYNSLGLTWGKETKILMIENRRFFSEHLDAVILKYVHACHYNIIL